jgi:SAM-dependent methyltransferase
MTYEPALSDAELARYYPTDYYAYRLEPPPGPGWRGAVRRLVDELQLGLRRGPATWPLRLAMWPLLWYKEVYGYARHLRGVRPGRLLDVGCGGGGFLAKAHAMGFAAEGVEPGVSDLPAMAAHGIRVVPAEGACEIVDTDNSEAAKSSMTTTPPTILIHSCRIEDFDPGAHRFDVITLNHVFEHVRDPAALWDRIDRWLAPGGRVLVRMPDTDSLACRRYRRFWYGLEVPRHLWLWDRRSFGRFLGRRGYEIRSFRKECVPLHWQYSLKRLLTGRHYSDPHWLDHPSISCALLPMVALFNLFGWSDMMAVWVEPTSALPLTPTTE